LYVIYHTFLPHQNFWSESYGQTIFSSIDYLWQELRRVLCRYGSSQGNFPKHMIKIHFPAIFTHYLCKFLHDAGVQSQVVVVSEPHRRIEKYFIYQMVSINQSYRCFYLEMEEQVTALASLLGQMSVFGIRARMPQKMQKRLSG
jgi:hypothetical protein